MPGVLRAVAVMVDALVVALSWRWSDFVVRPIKGAVIGSGFLLGYK
jgi:hypothetical protein